MLIDGTDPEARKLFQSFVDVASQAYRDKRAGPAWDRYTDQPVTFITQVLKQHRGATWAGWRTILKAAFGEPLTEEETNFFYEVSGNRNPPKRRVKELWCIVGRRGGKDSTASVIAVEAARKVDTSRLRPGERPIVACLANTKDQATIAWRYIKGYFDTNRNLEDWLQKKPITSRVISLKNDVDIVVATNNFRAPRGHPIACAILDEVAFFRDEESANPDIETYRALRPGMLTIPNSMIIGISSPHRKSGLLFKKFEDCFGKDDDDVLVIKARTEQLNPVIEELYPGEIQKAYDDDPQFAAAEYGAEFRSDLADYVDRDVVRSCIETGVSERLWSENKKYQYYAFADPSGGSRDSYTLAIAHQEGELGVLDCIREIRAPFKPEEATAELCKVLDKYRVGKVTGDRYAGEWPREQFTKRGKIYEPTEIPKSEMYVNFLPLLNSNRVKLLDDTRMFNQFCQLELRTARGGRDSVDHPKGGMDDVANAVTGALLQVIGDERASVVRRYLLGH